MDKGKTNEDVVVTNSNKKGIKSYFSKNPNLSISSSINLFEKSTKRFYCIFML